MAAFHDYFPDLQYAAKEYTHEQYAQKSADFTAFDLADFIDKRFYEVTNTTKSELLVF
jgi:hypothetical protein